MVVGLPEGAVGAHGRRGRRPRSPRSTRSAALAPDLTVEMVDERLTTVIARTVAHRGRGLAPQAQGHRRQGGRGRDPAVVPGRAPVTDPPDVPTDVIARRTDRGTTPDATPARSWPRPARSGAADADPTRAASPAPTRRRGRLLLVLGLLALPFVARAARGSGSSSTRSAIPGPPVAVTIPKGEGVSGIGDRLERRGVIGSSLAFSVYAAPVRLVGLPGREVPDARGPRRAQRHRRARAWAEPALHHARAAARADVRRDRGPHRRAAGSERARARSRSRPTGTIRSKFEPAGTNSLEGLTWPDSYAIEDHETEADILRTIVGAFDRHATAAGLADRRRIRTAP